MKSIKLSDEDWNKILTMLSDFPFKTVAPLLQNMLQQLNEPPAQENKDV